MWCSIKDKHVVWCNKKMVFNIKVELTTKRSIWCKNKHVWCFENDLTRLRPTGRRIKNKVPSLPLHLLGRPRVCRSAALLFCNKQAQQITTKEVPASPRRPNLQAGLQAKVPKPYPGLLSRRLAAITNNKKQQQTSTSRPVTRTPGRAAKATSGHGLPSWPPGERQKCVRAAAKWIRIKARAIFTK